MHLVDVVLFLHIIVAIAAFGVAAVLLTGLAQMRSAKNMSALRSWAGIVHRAEPLFPVLVVVLIALGAWLIALSDGEFGWSQGWIIVTLVSLVIMEAFGGAVLAPAGKRLHARIEAEPDGPVSPELRAAITDPVPWLGGYFNTGIAIGIVFLMANKPNGLVSVLVVVIASALACGVGARLRAPARARASEPAAELAAASVPSEPAGEIA
jgi:hypothetical protein